MLDSMGTLHRGDGVKEMTRGTLPHGYDILINSALISPVYILNLIGKSDLMTRI